MAGDLPRPRHHPRPRRHPVAVRARSGRGWSRCCTHWLPAHCPRTAEQFPIEAHARAARRASTPSTRTWPTTSARMRRMTLERAMQLQRRRSGHAEAAFEAFFAERNRGRMLSRRRIDALQRLAARVPLAALSNGNADLQPHRPVHMHFASSSARASTARPSRRRASSTPPARSWRCAPRRCCTSATTSTWMSSAPHAPACAPAGSTARRDGASRVAARRRRAPTWNSPPSPRWPTGWMRSPLRTIRRTAAA